MVCHRSSRTSSGLSIAMLAIAVGLFGASGAAFAQDLPAREGGRYALQPVEGGVIRMDTQTGALSMCTRQIGGSQWGCEALPDERKALQAEIDRLGKENGELMAEMKRLEEDLKRPERHADKGAGGEGQVPGIGRLPTEDDVDKAMTYLKGMYKKLKEKIREFEDIEGKKSEKL